MARPHLVAGDGFLPQQPGGLDRRHAPDDRPRCEPATHAPHPSESVYPR
eukprot:CAMPEP_0176157870 /NCGR_PEP_ID=MMETSP0120_2-20121206/80723_1 /TAXON_ID=160619 /ORGANISM="Kryptoperidinium foliaceum, Strain CCMP 1326" /LENGTH=48 /DNA_ID= /DNA_START= /DNA_END= /DNA_ORIENTATION=